MTENEWTRCDFTSLPLFKHCHSLLLLHQDHLEYILSTKFNMSRNIYEDINSTNARGSEDQSLQHYGVAMSHDEEGHRTGKFFGGPDHSKCTFKMSTPPLSPFTAVKSPSDSLLFPTPDSSTDFLFTSKQPRSPNDISSRLHISNLPFRFRNPDLVVLFSKYGTVVDAEIIFNEKGSKGFGFVSMSNPGEAAYARAVLQGAIVEGRRIDVNPATAKTMPRPVSALHMKPLQQDVEGQRKLVEAQTRLAELQLALMTLQKDSSQASFGPANFYC